MEKKQMSKARFEVSTEGMKGLHDGRPLWSLVKELVANAWDEDTSLCEVTIEPFKTKAKEDQIFIKVEDDGPGFKKK
jgi:DNA topoisomerase VI subunit B